MDQYKKLIGYISDDVKWLIILAILKPLQHLVNHCSVQSAFRG